MVSGLFDAPWVVAEGIDPDLIPATTITTNACHIIPQKMAAGHRIQAEVSSVMSRFFCLSPSLTVRFLSVHERALCT